MTQWTWSKKDEVPLSQVGTVLKKLMPKYRIKRYGCKTLGELYERLDPVRARQDGERGGGDDEKKRKRTIVAEFQMIPTRISPNFRLGHSNSTLDKVSKIAAHCLYLNCLSNL